MPQRPSRQPRTPRSYKWWFPAIPSAILHQNGQQMSQTVPLEMKRLRACDKVHHALAHRRLKLPRREGHNAVHAQGEGLTQSTHRRGQENTDLVWDLETGPGWSIRTFLGLSLGPSSCALSLFTHFMPFAVLWVVFYFITCRVTYKSDKTKYSR